MPRGDRSWIVEYRYARANEWHLSQASHLSNAVRFETAMRRYKEQLTSWDGKESSKPCYRLRNKATGQIVML